MSTGRQGPSRVVLVDKPSGWTSFDVVRCIGRGLKAKVGHAGTLDPFATGLLVVLTGAATRISSLVMELPKEYLVTARFGAVSSTGDPTGEIRETGGAPAPERILEALDGFRGRIRQRVPMTSAVKVGGERLYQKARRGEEISTPEREVTVYDAALLSHDGRRQEAGLLFRTSKGTYIRRIVEDLGEAVGGGAYAATLRRLSVGVLSVDAALPPESEHFAPQRLPESSEAVLPLSRALSHLPAHEVRGGAARRAANGNELRDAPEGTFRVTSPDGMLGVYRGEAGVARPVVVFPAPQD